MCWYAKSSLQKLIDIQRDYLHNYELQKVYEMYFLKAYSCQQSRIWFLTLNYFEISCKRNHKNIDLVSLLFCLKFHFKRLILIIFKLFLTIYTPHMGVYTCTQVCTETTGIGCAGKGATDFRNQNWILW